VAWSGAAPIARVEASVGEGDWQEARLGGGVAARQLAQVGALITRLDQAGASDMRARATDQAGNTQPERRRPLVSIAGAWLTLRRGLACRYPIFVSPGLRVSGGARARSPSSAVASRRGRRVDGASLEIARWSALGRGQTLGAFLFAFRPTLLHRQR
jgi:hypothetical protein